jgi:hypothetical protein
METTQQTTTIEAGSAGSGRSERASVERTLAGSYGIAAIAGLAVLIMAILALVNIVPVRLTAAAVIAGGLAFLVEGAGIAARARQIQHRTAGAGGETSALGGGVSVQLLAGVAGVTLGILALVGIEPITMLASSLIVFGAALLLGTLAVRETGDLAATRSEEGGLTQRTIQTSNGARVFVGLGALALGVLTVIGVGPTLVLTQIGLLAVGAILLLSGSVLGSRFGMAAEG